MKEIQVEICVDSLAGALAAEQGGAHRVELCDNLLEGGTTASAGAIKLVRQRLGIPVHVLIRPRGGDFLYSNTEFAVILEDIRTAREMGVQGIVCGCLTQHGDIDKPRLGEMISSARPLSFTFHRAFDMCREARRALEDLIELGVDRLLTSGQEASCLAGATLIAELQNQAGGRIVIMAGGGIAPSNVSQLVALTGVQEVHLSARSAVESKMVHRHTRCTMGGNTSSGEFAWKSTDLGIVQAVVRAVGQVLI